MEKKSCIVDGQEAVEKGEVLNGQLVRVERSAAESVFSLTLPAERDAAGEGNFCTDMLQEKCFK